MCSKLHACLALGALTAFGPLVSTTLHAVELPVQSGSLLITAAPTGSPQLAGDTIYTNTQTYAATVGPNNGYFRNWIVREAATGTLDYYYQAVNFTDAGAGPAAIVLNGIPTTAALDLSVLTSDATTPTPITASRTTSSIFVMAGQNAVLLHTADTSFEQSPTGVAQILFADGYNSATNLPIVVPGLPTGAEQPSVPEPATLALLPLALGALSLRLRRTRA